MLIVLCGYIYSCAYAHPFHTNLKYVHTAMWVMIRPIDLPIDTKMNLKDLSIHLHFTAHFFIFQSTTYPTQLR